jgi:hypothetical protein
MAGASRGIPMADGRDGAGRAVGKWIAGIVAAVLGSVLAFIVISKISGPATPATDAGGPTSSPYASSPPPPPLWYLTLTNEQLTAARLGPGNLDAGYTEAQVGAAPNECLDATATVLNDSGREAGPVQVLFSRPADNVHNDRVTSIQEALASYATDQAAAVAMDTFTGWISHCGNTSYKETTTLGRSFQSTVRVTTLSFQHHGDETLAATLSDHYYTIIPSGPRFSYVTQESILVVVRLHRTVCLFAIASEPVEDGHGYPSPPAFNDVNGIVTTAIGDVMSLGMSG